MLDHKCTDCGKELSISADRCPHCGATKPDTGWPMQFTSRHPVISGTISLAILGVGGYFLITFLSAVVASCASH